MQHDHNVLGQELGFLLPDWKQPEVPSREPMKGRFCRVEQLDPALHAASLHAANGIDLEGRMWTYLPYGPFPSFDAYRAWTEEKRHQSDPLFYAIIDTTSDQAVGVASYLRIDPAAGSIEVGNIGYSPLLQRTPAATEAMYLMMERVFTLGYRRYEWKCDALNTPSQAAARRLGFLFEGVFRQAAVVKGRNRDTAWFAVIDREWPSLREAFRRWLHPTNFDVRGKQRLQLSALRGTGRAPIASDCSASALKPLTGC